MQENDKKNDESGSAENDKVQNENAEKEKEKKELTVDEKLKETEEKLLRSLAEIENQRRRFAKESLAILDNLQRAKVAIKNNDTLKNNKDLDKFLENISIIEKDLISIFEKNNIKKIDAQGKKFDPNLHQAMTEIEDNNSEAGTIIQEIQAGYMLGDRLLRPALVAVAKKNKQKDEKKSEKK